MLCVTIFFSYLPEAGEYSSFFVYLRLVSMTSWLCLVFVRFSSITFVHFNCNVSAKYDLALYIIFIIIIIIY